MLKKYFSLAFLLLVLGVFRSIYNFPGGAKLSGDLLLLPGYETVFKDSNPETQLALGQKLSLSKLDIYDLELIPKMPSNIAEQLYHSKQAVIRRALELPQHENCRALTILPRVGVKTADQIGRYLNCAE